MVSLTLLYSFLSSLYLSVKLVTHHSGITYFMIFFPQFSVFIRQVGDSVHHYGITLWYYFLSSLYLSGKMVTLFIITVLLTLYFFLRSLYLSDKLVTLFIIMVLLTLWYSFLISLYLSDKLVTLFIIMADMLSGTKIAGQLRRNSPGHATPIFAKKQRKFEIPAVRLKRFLQSCTCVSLTHIKNININWYLIPLSGLPI